jgi:hypothetical protein
MTLSFGLAAFTGTAYSQGLAEYSVTTGNSSAAAAKFGSALNQTTKALAGRLANDLSKSKNIVPENKQKSGLKSPPAGGMVGALSAPNKPAAPFMAIPSACSPGEVTISWAKSGAEPVQANCHSSLKKTPPNAAAKLPAKPEPQSKYPSSINVSFAK